MKRRNYKGCELLPQAVSDAARAGDADAVEQVLKLLIVKFPPADVLMPSLLSDAAIRCMGIPSAYSLNIRSTIGAVSVSIS